MECVDLVTLVEKYDLALLDSSFLSGDGGNQSLSNKVYYARTSINLESIGEELSANYVHWSWIGKNILSMKGTATVSEVVEELKLLRIHLKRSYRYFSPQRPKTSFDGRKVPRKRGELDFDQSSMETPLSNSRSKSTVGLNALYKFLLQVDRNIKKLKEYYFINGVDRSAHTMRKNISLTNYALIDAGIDYLRQNHGTRVGIFTKDHHHIQILDDYLDQKISLPRGEIAVYLFSPGKVQNGSLWLKEGLVSECAPAEKYHLVTTNHPTTNHHETMEKVANI